MAMTKFSQMELLDCPDCSGLTEDGKCRLLNCSECQGRDCRFAETATDDSKQKAILRLRLLNEETQEHISQKYYGGSRPWMDTDAKPRR